MIEEEKIKKGNKMASKEPKEGHCHHFVQRKKRYCRMTVRPGGQFCGEHEPQLKDEQGDKRIACPNDPKHLNYLCTKFLQNQFSDLGVKSTVYVSKLEKHLSICNARATDLPPYIVKDINSPPAPPLGDDCVRVPLTQVPADTLQLLIQKINHLYETLVKDNIKGVEERPIHPAVEADFKERLRTESSLRHLRQASRLMWLLEEEGLVQEGTCYVELGAGKGQLSYYMGVGWCGGSSRVLAVDRAALRHKRERRGRGPGRGTGRGPGLDTAPPVLQVREGAASRVRADLAHLELDKVEHVWSCARVVGVAKHLCGAATDLGVRCVARSARAHGLLLATCCHHRCDARSYLANRHLQELGVSGAEFNVMLSVVSWATCGDGRSRDHDNKTRTDTEEHGDTDRQTDNADENENEAGSRTDDEAEIRMDTEKRAEIGRRAKALIDWGRVVYLRELGFRATLVRYVPAAVSPENICILATTHTHTHSHTLCS